MRDLKGNEGNRLKINAVKGIWKDWGAGDSKDGDLIQLFIAMNNGDKVAGMRAAYAFLGIPFSAGKKNTVIKREIKYKKPPTSELSKPSGAVFEYLTKERGIPEEIIALYKVQQYTDGNGPGYAFVYVDPDKTEDRLCLISYVALKRNPDGSKIEKRSKDGKDSLFGIHIDHKKHFNWTRRIVISEGQIDAMSYAAQGIFAVSIPSGASNNKWIDYCWDYLENFDEIILSYDMDTAGREAISIVAGRLGIERCRQIILPFKDANACHIQGVQLTELVESAEPIKPARFTDSADLKDEVWRRLKLGRRQDQGIPWCGWDTEQSSIKFRQRPKEITIISGWPGAGKSTGLYQHVAYLIGVLQKNVAIASLEEDPEVIVQLIMTQMLDDVIDGDNCNYEDFVGIYDSLISGKLFVYNHRGMAPASEVFDFIEYAANRHGCDTVVIDSLLRTDLDIEDNDKANEFMDRAIQCVNSTGTHLYLVAHSNKSGGADEGDIKNMPKMNSVKGSASIVGIAFNVLVFWKNVVKHNILSNSKSSPDLVEKAKVWADGMICVRKQKVGGEIGEYPVYCNKDTGRFRRILDEKDVSYIKTLREMNAPF